VYLRRPASKSKTSRTPAVGGGRQRPGSDLGDSGRSLSVRFGPANEKLSVKRRK
jgi:hypothetical protein